MSGQPPSRPASLLTQADVADILNVSHMTVTRLVKSNALRAYLVGRQFRFKASDIEAYLEQQAAS